MSCPHIADSIADHFEELLTPSARQKHEQHLAGCSECRAEVEALDGIPGRLRQWQVQAVPEWDSRAIMRPQAARKTLKHRVSRWPAVSGAMSRWVPLAASMVLAVAVITQTRLEITDSAWTISFGAATPSLSDEQLRHYFSDYIDSQQADTQRWVEAALRTHGETTADSVYQWMTWMEQQRETDVARMEAGFRQLLDRDFQTVDSVRQLASYVMYQESP